MSTEVENAFVQQYSNDIFHLAQQKGSRLMPTVRVKNVTGKNDHFERMGATAVQKKTSRHADTPLIDTPHSRRRVVLEDYHWADLIDPEDEIRMLIDPRARYLEAGSFAAGRKMDDIIISAATGNAASIDASDSSSNVAFSTAMIVDEDFGSANSNLTFEKLNESRRLLRGNDIDPDEELFCVLGSDQLHNLLTESEIQSFDTNTVKALVNGDINTFMGYKFIHSERLSGAGTEADPKLVLAYAKSAIGVGLGSDIRSRVDVRADKSYATQVYNSMTLGAVRVEEEKIAQIQCVE